MATTDVVVKELISSDKLVKQQVRLGLDEVQMRNAHVDTLRLQILSLGQVSQEEACTINTTVENGGWDAVQRRTLATAINSKERETAQKRINHKGADCLSFELYLTPIDWALIDDASTPMMSKIACVQRRAKKMRLSYANERTKGRIAKLLRYRGVGGAEMTTEEWYKHKARVNDALDKLKKDGRGDIVDYPLDPRDLPPDLYNACYTDGDDAPAFKDVPELGACAAGLRKSHRTCKPLFGKEPSTTAQPMTLADFQSAMGAFGMCATMRRDRDAAAYDNPLLGLGGDRNRSQRPLVKAEPKTEDDVTKAPPEVKSENDEDESEAKLGAMLDDDERALRDALGHSAKSKGKAKGKAKAKGEAEAKAKARGRPKGKAKAKAKATVKTEPVAMKHMKGTRQKHKGKQQKHEGKQKKQKHGGKQKKQKHGGKQKNPKPPKGWSVLWRQRKAGQYKYPWPTYTRLRDSQKAYSLARVAAFGV